MFNTGLERLEDKKLEDYKISSLKVRSAISKPLKFVLGCATKGNVVLESYPKLDKNKPYIFVSTHYHNEDIISNIATIDKNAYSLIGTTDQIEHNP